MPGERILTGWGRTAPSRALVHEPDRVGAVATRMDEPSARGVIARGLGRAYGDAAQNAGGDVVACGGLDRIEILDPARGIVRVGAGTSIDALLRRLLPLGWFPTVVPGTSLVTVGGAIASDIHGKFRLGCFSDAVSTIDLVSPATGPVAVGPDDDAFWATSGGMGLAGIITGATLELQPVETAYMVSDTERVPDVDECMSRMLEGDRDYRYSVAWIDCMASGANLGRSVLTRGNHATAADLGHRHRPDPLAYAPRALLTAPPWLPDGLLNVASVRAFNELWYRRAPVHRHRGVEHLTTFFFPLDGVGAWNRVYGRSGLLQYQFVVPYGEERVVRTALERLSAARAPSFLAVLKRFEHASRSMLGFPMEGWTLALDVPAAGEDLARLLDGLDELVVAAGGRVYLTKDARLRPELLGAMYPRLAEWRAVRDRLDPNGIMCSDMDRRLDLTGRRSG